MHLMAERVEELLPENYGFFIMVYPFHRWTDSNFISNTQRDDVVKLMKEVIKRWEKRD